MSENNDYLSIASNERIEIFIKEAEEELSKIQPEIDYLIQCQSKFSVLKEQQFKLNSLILSLKSLISEKSTTQINIQNDKINETLNNDIEVYNNVEFTSVSVNNERKIFLPDQAITQVKNHLRTKNNLNYEIFKAIIFNSGVASTKEIKNYLIENNIKQPKSGKSFENVELKEISSRANYLVRKNILKSDEPGIFVSMLGWSEIK